MSHVRFFDMISCKNRYGDETRGTLPLFNLTRHADVADLAAHR